MTNAQSVFLDLIRSEMQQTPPDPASLTDLTEAEWNELFALSYRQFLLPFVIEAIYDAGISGLPHCFEEYRQIAAAQVIRQTTQSIECRAMYRSLRQKGMHPVIVKGSLCSRLYPRRNYRISADDDLFVTYEEFQDCRNALLAYGLTQNDPYADTDTASEIGFRDDTRCLNIELHRRLFDSDSDIPKELSALLEAALRSEAEETDRMLSLPPHTHLLFLLLHARKHFIVSGVGIRQTCDIALWAKANAERIDWQLLLRQCQSAHAELFAAAQFRIAEIHLGFRLPLPDEWRAFEIDPEPMLADMLEGGVHGANSLSRLHSSTVTLNALNAKRSGKHPGILASLFPGRAYMMTRYPYLKKQPLLLPVAWITRFIRYASEMRTHPDDNASESLRIAKKRIRLLRQYGIL